MAIDRKMVVIETKDPLINPEEAVVMALKDHLEDNDRRKLWRCLASRSSEWERQTLRLSSDEVDFGIWTSRRIEAAYEFFDILRLAASNTLGISVSATNTDLRSAEVAMVLEIAKIHYTMDAHTASRYMTGTTT